MQPAVVWAPTFVGERFLSLRIWYTRCMLRCRRLTGSVAIATLTLLGATASHASGTSFGLHDGATIGAEMAAGIGSSLLLLPIAAAYSLPHIGFEQYPYDSSDGYGSGMRDAAFELRGSEQLVSPRSGATHGLFRARGAARLGWDVALSSYAGRSLGRSNRASYYNAHLTANYWQNGSSLFDFGFGAGGFDAQRTRFGPSLEMNYEIFPMYPWNGYARAESSLIGGRLNGDLSAGIGASAAWVGLDLGYRAFLNPLRNAYGPEASLRFWF